MFHISLYKNERGAISVMVAFLMLTIIGFVALGIDLGFLVMEKEEHQTATEAAVESGVRVLHTDANSSYTKTLYAVLNSLMANGENVPPVYLYYYYFHPGFYDYKDIYGDFGHFKNFASYRHGEIPEDEALNAVGILELPKDVETINEEMDNGATGRVKASAIAYGKTYTFLALDDTEDAMVWSGSREGYPDFRNCLLGSNGDVIFFGGETFDSRTIVEAAGTVLNRDYTKPSVKVKAVDHIKIPEINWSKLRNQAEANGRVYDAESWSETYQSDEYGNQYRRKVSGWAPNQTIYYCFLPNGQKLDMTEVPIGDPADGDHQGRTYFFDIPDTLPAGASSIVFSLYNTKHYSEKWPRKFWNCTIAANCTMSTFPADSAYMNTCFIIGDYETYGPDGLVYLYCHEFQKWYTRYSGGPGIAIPKGTVVRCKGEFKFDAQHSWSSFGGPETYYLKAVAGNTLIKSPGYRQGAFIFMGGFSAPDLYLLGNLD